ncbi:hypothetical protein HSR122_0676 [Halapricum desulfuricans]|uniref:Uncharacterized protein n=1 Tax=Halapricum desulfuricans TaxID=2841257 RepID=A0A897N5H4_9EURY|nr:hypothetical protein HSR122_0676 [Halapricum desulfuricans]
MLSESDILSFGSGLQSPGFPCENLNTNTGPAVGVCVNGGRSARTNGVSRGYRYGS